MGRVTVSVNLTSPSQFVLCLISLRLPFICNSQGTTARRFVDHDNDVLSVAFSADNRQIVSGSRDGSIKLWNTLGECKFTITDGGHDGWVSFFSPSFFLDVDSAGCDGLPFALAQF